MAAYVLLSKLPAELTKGKGTLRKAANEVRRRIKDEAPGVKWISSYGVFGRYDILDVFEAPDTVTAARVATIIRDAGATTETWLAMPFEDLLRMTD
jgi:uncharacterized protein with GYD domain